MDAEAEARRESEGGRVSVQVIDICDRCGTRFLRGDLPDWHWMKPVRLTITLDEASQMTGDFKETKDLCGTCRRDLKRFLDAPVKESAA